MAVNQWELSAERFLSQEEVGKLLQKAHELMIIGKARKRKALVRDGMIIFTGLYTGLRRFEMCELQVEDLKITNGRSHVIVKRGKNGRSRTTHIGNDYKKILKEYLIWKAENNELYLGAYLIRNERSEKYSPTGLWKRFKKYAPNGHRLHDLRHTNASMLYTATKDLKIIAKQLGHASIQVSAQYASHSVDALNAGMNQMEHLAKIALKSVSK